MQEPYSRRCSSTCLCQWLIRAASHGHPQTSKVSSIPTPPPLCSPVAPPCSTMQVRSCHITLPLSFKTLRAWDRKLPCQCSATTASDGLVLQGRPPPSSLSRQTPSTLSLRACRIQQRPPRAADLQYPITSPVISCS